MNYFGLIFCFMVPGIIVGLLLSSGISSASGRRARNRRV